MVALMHAVAVVEWLGINGLTLTISGLALALGSYLVSIINCAWISSFQAQHSFMLLTDIPSFSLDIL